MLASIPAKSSNYVMHGLARVVRHYIKQNGAFVFDVTAVRVRMSRQPSIALIWSVAQPYSCWSVVVSPRAAAKSSARFVFCIGLSAHSWG